MCIKFTSSNNRKFHKSREKGEASKEKGEKERKKNKAPLNDADATAVDPLSHKRL